MFHSVLWDHHGSRKEFSNLIFDTTGIDGKTFPHRDYLKGVSVARKMSWVSKTSDYTLGDRAYSLLGIFDVNMPLLYGEGEKSFSSIAGRDSQTN